MDDDQTNSAQSDLEGLGNMDSQLPNPIIVALLIIGVSFLVGMVFAAVQLLFNFTLPGGTAISTMVPALVVGYIYGSKREGYFPRSFRIKVIAIWIAISLALTVFVFKFVGIPLQEVLPSLSFLVPMFLVILMIATVVCYFAFKFGEKIGIDAAKKKRI